MSTPTFPYPFGKYEIQAELGRGGFATVFRATDTSLGQREVALKILAPELVRDASFLQRFQQEARTAARLRHPHIVTIYEMGEALGSYYIAMDMVPGPSLRERLQQQGALPWTEALTLLEQLAAALDYAHDQGVVHRDLKPGNILLDPMRGAMLTDFGFARLVGENSQLSLSLSGGVVGTPAYIPVEVWEGRRATAAADVYALACIFCELLTGTTLFAGDTPIVVMRLHDRGAQLPVAWPPDVPTGLTPILQAALAKDPDTRTARAGELVTALKQLNSQPVSPAPAPKSPPQPTYQYQQTIPPGSVRANDTPPPMTPDTAAATNQGQLVSPISKPPQTTSRSPWLWAVGGVVGVLLLIFAFTLGRGQGNENSSVAAAPTSSPSTSIAPTNTPANQPTNAPTMQPTSTRTPRPTNTPAPVLQAGTRVSPIDGMVQVYVPAGEFTMGNDDGNEDEQPVHTVYLDAYWIDRTEVTNAQFAQFVTTTNYSTTAELEGGGDTYWDYTEGADWRHPQGPGSSLNGLDNHPVVLVSWDDANAYCTWVGGSLPTEAQWEKAAGWDAENQQARTYPWGNTFDRTRLNFRDRNCSFDWKDDSVDDGYEDTAPVGSYPAGASYYGVLDMAGNVWEWAADWYNSSYYQNSPAQNPQGPATGDYRVLRGGSWNFVFVTHFVRATSRYYYDPADRYDGVGFRCAQE